MTVAAFWRLCGMMYLIGQPFADFPKVAHLDQHRNAGLARFTGVLPSRDDGFHDGALDTGQQGVVGKAAAAGEEGRG